MLDIVGNQRRSYSIVKAREIITELRGKTICTHNEDEVEYWLTGKIDALLHQYQEGLEAIANSYHSMACDALNLKAPEPLFVRAASAHTEEEGEA